MSALLYVLGEDDEPQALPLDEVERWGEWLVENRARRILARTAIGAACEASTIFAGVDLRTFPDDGGMPLLYETMVWGGPNDLQCWRYPTRRAALAGHAEVVALQELLYERARP